MDDVSIMTASGEISVRLSGYGGVILDVSRTGLLPLTSTQIELSVGQSGELASVLLSACRASGSEPDKADPGAADELITLAERLRSDQSNVTQSDLRLAAGYLELLFKLDSGDTIGNG